MTLDELYSDFKCRPYAFFQYNIEQNNKKYIFEILFHIHKKVLSKYEFTYILNERFNLVTSGNQKINFKRLSIPEFQNKNIEITIQNECDFLINDSGNRNQFINELYNEQFTNIIEVLKNYNFSILN